MRKVAKNRGRIGKYFEANGGNVREFTSAFENGGKEVQEVKEEEAKNPPEHLARRDEEKRRRARPTRKGQRTSGETEKQKQKQQGKGQTARKGSRAERRRGGRSVVLAKRLSFLETTKKEQTDDEATSAKSALDAQRPQRGTFHSLFSLQYYR